MRVILGPSRVGYGLCGGAQPALGTLLTPPWAGGELKALSELSALLARERGSCP